MAIIRRADDPDTAIPVTSYEIPAQANLYQTGNLAQTGNLLVSVVHDVIDASTWPYRYETEVSVYDLSDPTTPSQVGTLVTDRLYPGQPHKK